ncbi:exodeoxyribonuclease V subunit gamma [Alteromonas genovensis]|uniref:exodeoxyribonuclease V subunit gamma n=1 Tax=Alteromonas genovensis TaxID=471225 RepID=UPI002FE09A77
MLALYPSNKLEHLSFLLTSLLEQQPSSVFSPETILVESPGMQHWVSMQLAREQGIAMNLDFPLPVRFMWNTARVVLGSEKVPRQSPYRREVLTWRIDNILQDDALMTTGAFEQVRRYWLSAGSEQEQGVQRLQLATALADVYEQYLLYRPDWLFAWENNEQVVFDDMESWQSEIWRILTKEQPLHPARLHKMTIEALSEGQLPTNLPSRIVVFAINTMAPQLIAFFDALAEHIDIHIFHLNPSVNYWGDAKSDSELAKQLRMEGVNKWMENEQSNSLLGNLGKQGRELFNLLTELDTFEISAFDAPEIDEPEIDALDDALAQFTNSEETSSEEISSEETNFEETILEGTSLAEKPQSTKSLGRGLAQRNLLKRIHSDILQALPASPIGVSDPQEAEQDDSVTIMCTHSALREVQVLHDHLLHWLSQDTTRTPSDILVMCPAIENYAPFVDAVFHRVGTKNQYTNGTTRLPCSIADRSPMDTEPLIAAFMALLELPDSRFGVADIMDYLQLDSVQKRFNVTQADIDQMMVWLEQAHIHWGLNAQHKASVSEGVTKENTYSWWWGIRRLLMGMLAPDSEMIVDGSLTIPDVEGQSALILGKLVQVIDLLGRFANELTTPRSPKAWAQDLLKLRDACFVSTKDQEQSWDLIAKVAADLYARCNEADYEHELSLRQIRELLLSRFSSPDAGNHFMTGQVTVCSMLPMRSIPFKKVCILGLNDSEFPRKATPLGLDLMAGPKRRTGDRSRRLEDRYLFLEAIISTRESLYLSYQGNDVKNNSERQPSLVLAEFLDMLATGYQLDTSHFVKHAPLHPFSEAAFTGQLPSYETGWLRLADALQKTNASQTQTQPQAEAQQLDSVQSASLETKANTQTGDKHSANENSKSADETRLSTMQVARAFKDPLECFSLQRLGVDLSQSFILLDNSEPFETNALVRYQVLDAIFSVPSGQQESSHHELSSEQVVEFASLRGDIPNNPVAKEELQMWKDGALALTQAMGPHDAAAKNVSFVGKHITFTASAFEAADSLVLQSAGKINDIRALSYFMSQLVFCAESEASTHHGYPLDIYYCDWEKGETKLMKRRFAPFDAATAENILLFIEQLYMAILTAPTPLYRSLYSDLVPGKRNSDSKAIVGEIKPEHYDDIMATLQQSSATAFAYRFEEQGSYDKSSDYNSSDDTKDSETAPNVVSEKAQQIVERSSDLFNSIEAERVLKNWLQSSGQFSADMANNPYLKWLFPDGISWQSFPHVEGFILFSMVANCAAEEQL